MILLMHDSLYFLKAGGLNFDFEEVVDALRQVCTPHNMVSAWPMPMLSQCILFPFQSSFSSQKSTSPLPSIMFSKGRNYNIFIFS